MLDARSGKPLSTASTEAAQLYLQGVDLILGSESGAAAALDQALALDSNFAVAAAARYYVAKDTGESGAQVHRERAQQSLGQASAWERQHVELVIGMIDQPSAIQEKVHNYINTTPTDLLVISQLAGYTIFFGGPSKLERVLKLLESVEGALMHDWAYLARLGFAASEAGQRERGRKLLERALALRPQALYSIHGLAHALHDEGAAEESVKLLQDWLVKFERNARAGQMYGHVQWHLALAEWQTGARGAAMQRYQAYCAPETTTCGPMLTLADCGGFLLRDYLQSGQARPLDRDVLAHIERVWEMLGHPFVALHVAGLYASAGDLGGLNRCAAALASKPAGVNRDLSLALVSALNDFVAGDFASSTQTLASISPSARIGIGGSRVERILVDLLEAQASARQ